ncbi:lipase family protein [Paenibacillus athensensis]|uniref:Lipase n=1 Tax=Paenibacillus athensensis TaxID=1967502 RepID=A0A4Y8Q8Q3_9BACL|nr:lipase family protein [Paenibacillus athensensis]MCD1260088.1 lipase family protein [Paenibacillus athensensis]
MAIDSQWQERIFWGQFVQVAYEMYAQNHQNPPTPDNFPVGWQRVADLQMAPKLALLQEREFAGVLARSQADPLHWAVVFRGTESPMDWLADFEFKLETITEVPNGGRTEQGFTNLYRSVKLVFGDGATPDQPLLQHLDQLPAGSRLTVSGHSLGGAIATLHGFVAGSKQIPVEVITFASPRVGDADFVAAFQRLVPHNTRVFNLPDLVPTVPPELAGYRHVETGVEISSLTFPVKHSIVCYHTLKTYLYVMGAQVELGSCLSS